MPKAPRVLIAIAPSPYAEVLAFSIGQHRPRAEVSVLDPSEQLEGAVLGVRPHLVVANRVPGTASGEIFWVKLDEPRARRSSSSAPILAPTGTPGAWRT
jgi:hypothetical protein